MTASAGPDALASVIEDADSDSWSVRAAAGRCLAAHAEGDEVARILHRLLLDGRDTAVTQTTAEALLRRGDALGLRLVLKALALASDPAVAAEWDAATMDEIYAAVAGDPRWLTEAGHAEFATQLRGLTAYGDADVAGQARSLLDRMHGSSVR